jgi:type I restriction enzyme, S subunit
VKINSSNTVSLGEVLEYEQPTKYIVDNTNYDDEFDIPVLTAGKSFLLGYTNETHNVFSNVPVIIFDDFTTAFKYVDFPFKVKSSAMKILKANKEVADIRFLYYRMMKTGIDTELHKRYWISKYSKVKIPLPPLDQQKKIAAILDAADAYRQKTKALIEKYDELTQSLFLDMFGDPFVNQNNYPYVKLESLVKNKKDIVDGPFGSSVNTKVDYIEEGEIPVIRTKNIGIYNEFKSDDLKFMTREKYETIIRSQVIPGDIVLTKVGTIGNVCVFPETYKEAVLSTTGSCRIRINQDIINKKYFLFYLKLYRPKMNEIASAGVQAFLNMKHIKGFDILMPPLTGQNQFAERVQAIETQKAQAQDSLAQAEDLFNSLLQRAFKGELS